MVQCASIKDLSIEKRILKIAKKIRPRAEKYFRGIFLALISRKICFYNFEVIFGHNGVKIGGNVYFCIRIKKAKVNFVLKSLFTPLKLHFLFWYFQGQVTKKAVERPR